MTENQVETRSQLDREATEALDASAAAKARLSRVSEVDRMVSDRREERDQERRRAFAAEETRQRHEDRAEELRKERRKLEEKAEKEAEKLKGTLVSLRELHEEHSREYAQAGGKARLAATPFGFTLTQWFGGVFAGSFKQGPIPTAGGDVHNGGMSLVERDNWTTEGAGGFAGDHVTPEEREKAEREVSEKRAEREERVRAGQARKNLEALEKRHERMRQEYKRPVRFEDLVKGEERDRILNLLTTEELETFKASIDEGP